ncbi:MULTISPECIES: TonB-dependent receptor [Sphingomonas]|uniref:TonB-dependent receptor n=1 Tax=Sphingomonas TaxID=13687 RepID=UPI001F084663|nr:MULTISPECIES: TonB-dependent receptor [Sphingomonas]
MTSKFLLLAGSAMLIASPAVAQEVAAPPPPATPVPATAPNTAASQPANAAEGQGQDVVVTARKREETLKDVPVAATAVTGDTIERRGFTAVRDVATISPSVNINSDGAGRAFVAIRGVGTTLIDTVQPGVGIFVDGIYQPNTSYLNNPLTDVERVEILRGPQGTLYGKNTLGGAINVITRQPSNRTEIKGIASYAGPDNQWIAGGSISGPIIRDRLQARIAYTHQQQDGFIHNTLLNVDQNPLNTDALSGTVRATPADNVQLTVNGYYTWVKGGAVPYAFVSGPTDYKSDVAYNSSNYQFFKYRGLNAKLEFPLDALSTKVTLIGAYDRRGVTTDNADPDFTAADTLRQSSLDDLKTKTAELRFDSTLSSTLSSIIGLFYSRETRTTDSVLTVLPGVLNLTNTTHAFTGNTSTAAFGTLFWRPSDAWEVSAGLRYDHQKRRANGLQVNAFPNALAGLPPATVVTGGAINETNVSPRVAVTRHWNRELMTYASVARGSRGGGFNPPAVPANLRTYKGDSAWTYELGTKYASADRRVSLAADVFYNNYKDYIGLNSILRTAAGFTTIDLNTGNVKSYGVEIEGTFRPTENWTLTGGGSLMHARITNDDIYTATTGRTLASDRLPFQPDYNYYLNSDYVVPLGKGSVAFDAGVVGKGSRIPASIRQIAPEVPGQPPLRALKAYALVNASLTYRVGGIEIGGFVDNLFNKKYFESYIERTTLILAGLPNSDVGIIGDKRRYGVRTRFRF